MSTLHLKDGISPEGVDRELRAAHKIVSAVIASLKKMPDHGDLLEQSARAETLKDLQPVKRMADLTPSVVHKLQG